MVVGVVADADAMFDVTDIDEVVERVYDAVWEADDASFDWGVDFDFNSSFDVDADAIGSRSRVDVDADTAADVDTDADSIDADLPPVPTIGRSTKACSF